MAIQLQPAVSKPPVRRGGRPRLVVPPKCSLHPGSKVYLDDRRGQWSPFHEKRGFRCYPRDGAPKHRLSTPERMRHPTANHPHSGGACPTCDTDYAPNAGPRLGEDFTFTSQEIAKALYLVGTGESYRKAAAQTRKAASRFMFDPSENTWATDPLTGKKVLAKKDPRKVRAVAPNRYSTESNLTAAYLDGFGRVIADELRPRRWPRFVMIDSGPLRTRKTDPNLPKAGGAEAGEILAVVDRTTRPGRVFTLHLAGGKSHVEWLRFFDRPDLEGEPEWIVADKDPGIELAVKTKWPNAILYNCEGHLWRNAVKHAGYDGIPEWVRKPGAPKDAVMVVDAQPQKSHDRDIPWPVPSKDRFFERHPLYEAMGHMFDSLEAWDRFKEVAEATIPPNRTQVRGWIRLVEIEILQQFAWRQQFPSAPRGVGPVESVLQTVKNKFQGRVGRFSNARRLQTLLDLMALHFAGLSSEVQYTSIVRNFFQANAGHSGQNRATWPQFWDPKGTSSLDDLIARKSLESAAIRVEKQDQSGMAGKQARIDADAAARAAAGLPPDRGRIRRTTPKVKPPTRGKFVTDFPDVLAQWDYERNGPAKDPAKTRANSHAPVFWRCNAHVDEPTPHLHLWESQVASRIGNDSGCRFCMNRAACPSNSLATMRPEIAAEWHPTKNGALTPDDVLAAGSQVIWWKCSRNGRHPAFKQGIATRTRQMQGCPKCGIELRAERRRERSAQRETDKRAISRELRAKIAFAQPNVPVALDDDPLPLLPYAPIIDLELPPDEDF